MYRMSYQASEMACFVLSSNVWHTLYTPVGPSVNLLVEEVYLVRSLAESCDHHHESRELGTQYGLDSRILNVPPILI